MRVLFLLTQDLQSPSGLGRYWPIARELARLGHAVSIVALHSKFELLGTSRIDTIEGVQIRYVAPMHVRKEGSQKYYYSTLQLVLIVLRATWQLTWAALCLPADIVYVGKPHPMNGVAGLFAHYLRGRQLYVDCDDDETASGRFGSGWQKWGVSFFERCLPRHAQCVTTNTLFMRARLLAAGLRPERVVYLPNGVERKRFTAPDPARVAQLRADLAVEGKWVVAYIGSLSLPSHPVDLLVEAFAQVWKANRETVLLLVGGGEDVATLQRQVQTLGLSAMVRFVGRVPPEQVPLYYQMAHVTVDPVCNNDAARGRAPLKLFESWAAGVPFVTADVGDRRVLLGTPPAGELVQPGDADALAQGILHILADPDHAQGLQQHGREQVKNFYWERLVKRLEVTYQGS